MRNQILKQVSHLEQVFTKTHFNEFFGYNHGGISRYITITPKGSLKIVSVILIRLFTEAEHRNYEAAGYSPVSQQRIIKNLRNAAKYVPQAFVLSPHSGKHEIIQRSNLYTVWKQMKKMIRYDRKWKRLYFCASVKVTLVKQLPNRFATSSAYTGKKVLWVQCLNRSRRCKLKYKGFEEVWCIASIQNQTDQICNWHRTSVDWPL